MRRSLSDLELEEVQGFKDLGFYFEKEALSPSLIEMRQRKIKQQENLIYLRHGWCKLVLLQCLQIGT
ncbi:hypothetical protein Lal_00018167 [Lupinus albus]|nr:hypothetical protein Lal_00018167 [Lupinus albus]